MSIQDKQMLNDLVVESREHLTSVEPDLLELEQKGANVSDELINRVFRAVHSIKGGFGFFGIDHVTKLSHAMENVMSKVRDKTLAVSSDLVDALLVGVDKLRVLLDDIENADRIAIQTELEKLSPFVEGKSTPARIQSDQSADLKLDETIRRKHKDLTDQQVVEAIRNGKTIYQIVLDAHTDLEEKKLTPIALFEAWESIGEILDIALDFDAITGLSGATGHSLKYSVILASVLEPDLISTGIGIATDRIYSFDTAAIRNQIVQSRQPAQEKPPSAPPREAADAPAPVPETEVKRSETRIEDALRVKVGLLNKLMNLAGELVLSRNQLLQSMGRTVSASLESDRIFKEFDRQVKNSCDHVAEALTRDPGNIRTIMGTETERLRNMFRQCLNFTMNDLPGIRAVMQNLDLVTSMLQESIMQTRLQPISVLFSKFPRIIRDLAKKLGKEVELTLVGQDVELDKSIIELLSDPLTHLIRNSVDHGIELPDKRAAAGKNRTGQVVLRAFHEGGKVNIQIRDDGGGIDTERVRQKAIEKGMVTAEVAAKMTDLEVNKFVMAPGFSTAQVVSDVSGRGVGMDVVKTNIERLGGTIEISSIFGRGTTITMQLPLTLAIISSLVVTAEGRRFAIPQVGIEELVRIRAKDITKKIERVGQSEVYRLRGKLLPLVRLAKALDISPTFIDPETGERKADQRGRWSDRRGKGKDEKEKDATQKHERTSVRAHDADERRGEGPDRRNNINNAVKIVVARAGDNIFGLVVDDVFDSEEIVVKPLSSYIKSTGCYAGSTIMGDGSVAMILDTNGIARLADLKFDELEKASEAESQRTAQKTDSIFQDVLLFDNGAEERLGVELSRIARIEKVENSRIERIGSKEFVRYDKNTLPLIRLQDYLPVAPPAQHKDFQFVIVPKADRSPIGIAIEQVHDVIHTELSVDTSGIKGKGIIGSAVMNSRMTLLVDLQEVLESARAQLA